MSTYGNLGIKGIWPGMLDWAKSVRSRSHTTVAITFSLMTLVGCSAPVNQVDESTGFIKELPEDVALIAAPYQNLREVILKPEDSCYWYRHVGPVETTMLPLRTKEGRPICTSAIPKPAQTG